ncbi:MAG: hypothetical protein SOV66_07550, partial [Sodaliphilus sp.]|nr:hypothetical protein [Sodaliphilus sp.]
MKNAVAQTIIRNFTFGYGLVPCPKNDIVGKNIYLSYSFIFHDTQLKAPPLATMPFASQGTTSQSRYISF